MAIAALLFLAILNRLHRALPGTERVHEDDQKARGGEPRLFHQEGAWAKIRRAWEQPECVTDQLQREPKPRLSSTCWSVRG